MISDRNLIDKFLLLMPEGPEVACVAEELDQELRGKYILDVHIFVPLDRGRQVDLDRIPPGTLINQIWSRGKKIIFELSYTQPDSGVQYTFYWLCSLLMSGCWYFDFNSNRNNTILALDLTSNYDSSAITILENRCNFQDNRKRGQNRILWTSAQLSAKLAELGPDLLRDNVLWEDYEQVVQGAIQRCDPTKQVCAFLMEQKYFCGVGNYLLAEICYRSGIHPAKPLSCLDRYSIYLMWHWSRTLIRLSYQARGLTISTYSTPSGKFGSFDCFVYNRSTDPFGAQVEKEVFGNSRTSHFVPSYFDSALNYIGPPLEQIWQLQE